MPERPEGASAVLDAANLKMRQLGGHGRLVEVRVSESGTWWMKFCGEWAYLGEGVHQALETARRGDWVVPQEGERLGVLPEVRRHFHARATRGPGDRVRDEDTALEGERVDFNRAHLAAWKATNPPRRVPLELPGERLSGADEASLFDEEGESYRMRSIDLYEVALVELREGRPQEFLPLEGLYQERGGALIPTQIRITAEAWNLREERPCGRDPRLVTRKRMQVVLMRTSEGEEDPEEGSPETIRNVKVYDRRGEVIMKMAGDAEGRVYFQDLFLADAP